MRIWITGENGFIAKTLTKHCSGEYEIENSYLNNFYDYWRQTQFKKDHDKEIDVFDPALKKIVERSEIDVIIHTATLIDNKDSQLMIRQNIEGSYHIAKIAKELDIPVVIVHYDQHFNNNFMWTQRTVVDMFRSMGINFTQIITGELFGSEDIYGSISQLLMTSVGKLDQAKITTNLSLPKNYVYIQDFIDGLIKVIDNLDYYKNKSISLKNSEKEMTLEDIIDYMSEVMEITVQYNIIEQKEVEYSNFNTVKLEGWESKVPFKDALKITREKLNDKRE